MSDYVKPGSTFSTNEMMKSIIVTDSAVELIGFVESMSGPEHVGNEKEHLLMKFILNNGSGCSVLVKIWNEQIARFKSFIRPNFVLHIDGASARKIKTHSNFKTSKLNYELVLQSNTIVKCLRIHKQLNLDEEESYNFCKLENLGKEKSKLIKTEGFLKTTFNKTNEPNGNSEILCGSITDGLFKIEFRIYSFNLLEDEKFEKGDKILIQGKLVLENPIYFRIESSKDISKMQCTPRMSQKELNKGVKRIMVEEDNSENEMAQKVLKLI